MDKDKPIGGFLGNDRCFDPEKQKALDAASDPTAIELALAPLVSDSCSLIHNLFL